MANRFCGPWALALAGCYADSDAAARALREVSGRRSIHGVDAETLLRGAVASGACVELVGKWAMWPVRGRPTVREFRTQFASGTFILRLRGHYVVVHEGRSADNEHPWWRDGWKDFDKKRLLEAWQVTIHQKEPNHAHH